MGARQRLNSVYLTIVFFFAAIIGSVFESWVAFFVIAAVLLVALVHGGDIRPTRISGPRRSRNRRR